MCSELRAFLDNELGWLGNLRMRLHLRRCPRCIGAKAEHERLDALLAQAAQVSASERLLATWQAGMPTATPTRGYATETVGRRLVLGTRKMKWAGVSATAIVVLVTAIGWLHMSSQPLLARALRATESARSVHAVLKRSGGSSRTEGWAEGWQKYRVVTTSRDDETYQSVVVRNGNKEWFYNTESNKVTITEGDLGPPREDVVGLVVNPALLLKLALQMKDKIHIEEYDDAQPNGQVVHVVVMQQGPNWRNLFFIDLDTNRLVGYESQRLEDGQWRTTSEMETIEYDKPIPEELFTFEPPEGTKIVVEDLAPGRNLRFEGIAEQTRAGWRVVIESVNVARDGTVFVPLFRANVEKRRVNGAIPLYGRLIDERGRTYAQYNFYGVRGWRWTLTFTPVEPLNADEPLPQRFTIELNPYVPSREQIEEWQNEGVTMRFENMPARPLPPELVTPDMRADDPYAKETLKTIEARRSQAIERYRREYRE